MKTKFVDALSEMIGGTVQNVAYAERESGDHVFIFFTDGTHMELYTAGEMRSSKGRYHGTAKEIEASFKRDRLDYVIK